MAVLTPKEALEVCYEAGFRWNYGIVTMPCIGWAESRLNTEATHTNTNGTIDRGWLQINSIHVGAGKLSVEDCFDPLKAAQFAYKLSNGGTKFSPWVAYNTGAYKGPDGVVWALFMAEWRDRAARVLLAAKDEVLKLTTDELMRKREELATTAAKLSEANDEIELLSGSLGRMMESRDAALAKIEAAKVALS